MSWGVGGERGENHRTVGSGDREARYHHCCVDWGITCQGGHCPGVQLALVQKIVTLG